MSVTPFFLLLCLLPIVRCAWAGAGSREQPFHGAPPISGAVLFLLLSVGSALMLAIYLAVLPDAPLAALALAIGSVASLAGPVPAVSFLVANLVLRPWETAVTHPLALSIPKTLAAIAMGSYVLALLRKQACAVRFNRMLVIFSGLVAWFFASTMFSQSPDRSLTALTEFFPVVVTVFLIANTFTRAAEVRTLRTVLLIAVCGIMLDALVRTVGAPPPADFDEEAARLHTLGLWGNANDLGAMITLVLPFVVLAPRAGTAGLWLKSAAICLLGTALWYTQSRGSIIALAAGMGLYFLCCSRTLLTWIAVLCIGAVVPALFFLNLYRNADELATSTAARKNLAIAGVRMAIDYPIFGVGVGNYPKLYEAYTPSFEEWGERNAHSTWILTLAETGVPGGVLFVMLFVWALRTAWCLRLIHPELFVSLTAYGISMSFLSHTYNLLPYLLFVMVLVFARTSAEVVEDDADALPARAALQPGYL